MGCEEGIDIIDYFGIRCAREMTKNRLTWPGNKVFSFGIDFMGEYDWEYFNKTTGKK